MRQRKLQNYLRTYRKRTGLSQQEIAFLLGCKSSAKVSRYEGFSRQPNIQTAFAFAVIFNIPTRDLFAGLFQEVERNILQRASLLSSKLRHEKSPRLAVRGRTILNLMARSKAKPPGD